MPALIDALESANFGFFAEEFCIPANDTRDAYQNLCVQLSRFNRLLQLFPDRQEKTRFEFAELKKKIIQELMQKSLLLPGNDSNLFSLSGNPFPTKQN